MFGLDLGPKSNRFISRRVRLSSPPHAWWVDVHGNFSSPYECTIISGAIHIVEMRRLNDLLRNTFRDLIIHPAGLVHGWRHDDEVGTKSQAALLGGRCTCDANPTMFPIACLVLIGPASNTPALCVYCPPTLREL